MLVYMLTFGVYSWDPCYHSYSSTMDPSWVSSEHLCPMNLPKSHQSADTKDLKPNTITYNAAVDACRKGPAKLLLGDRCFLVQADMSQNR